MTEAAYADIAQRSVRLTFREVAEDYPLSHVTVKNVFEDFMREHASRLRFTVPASLGIYEKNLKRVGMVTVITDLENRTVFDMVPGRKQADLESYFSSLEGLDRIIASNGLTIGPHVDAPGPLFVTEPDHDGEAVDEFIGPRTGPRIDAETDEVL